MAAAAPPSSGAAGSSSVAAAAAAAARYEQLCSLLREIAALEGVSGLLGWDEQTIMPEGAAEARAAQKAALAGVVHEKATAAALAELVCRARHRPGLWHPLAFDRLLRVVREGISSLVCMLVPDPRARARCCCGHDGV